MNCRKVNHLLSAYMDGELPGVEHRQIHEHLARCTECATEYSSLLRMKRLLAGLRVYEPGPDLPARILEQAHTSDSSPLRMSVADWLTHILVRLKQISPKPQYLAIGAGLALLGVFVASNVINDNQEIHWTPVADSPLAAGTVLPSTADLTMQPDTRILPEWPTSKVSEQQIRPLPIRNNPYEFVSPADDLHSSVVPPLFSQR